MGRGGIYFRKICLQLYPTSADLTQHGAADSDGQPVECRTVVENLQALPNRSVISPSSDGLSEPVRTGSWRSNCSAFQRPSHPWSPVNRYLKGNASSANLIKSFYNHITPNYSDTVKLKNFQLKKRYMYFFSHVTQMKV